MYSSDLVRSKHVCGALVRVESLTWAKLRVRTVPSSSHRFVSFAMIRVSLSVHEPRVVDVSRPVSGPQAYIAAL